MQNCLTPVYKRKQINSERKIIEQKGKYGKKTKIQEKKICINAPKERKTV